MQAQIPHNLINLGYTPRVCWACRRDERRQAGARPLRVDGVHEAGYHGVDAVVAAAACVNAVLHGAVQRSVDRTGLPGAFPIAYARKCSLAACHG